MKNDVRPIRRKSLRKLRLGSGCQVEISGYHNVAVVLNILLKYSTYAGLCGLRHCVGLVMQFSRGRVRSTGSNST